MALSLKQQIISRWICLALNGLGFLCYCVAFVIPYWTFIRTDGHTLQYGIFTVCIVTTRSQACGTVSPQSVNGLFVTAQVCATLALLSYFVSAASCGMTLCWPYPWSRYLLFVCGGSALVTSLFGGTMTALYIIYHLGMTSSRQYGFYMATGSLCLTLIIGIFALLAGKATRRPKANISNDIYLSPMFVQKSRRSLPSTSTVPSTSSASTKVKSFLRVSITEPVASLHDRRTTVSTIHGSTESCPADKPVTTSQISTVMPIFKRTPQNKSNVNVRARGLAGF